MLVGIGFVAILTAAAAERFMHAEREAERDRQGLADRLDAVTRRLNAIEREER